MSGRRIIVGVDGSKASSAALQWALDEARDRRSDTQVHLVHVTPLEYVSALTGEAIAPRDDPAAEERGRRLLGTWREGSRQTASATCRSPPSN